MRVVGRVLAWLVGIVLVVALVLGIGGYVWLRGSLPTISGSVQVSGLSAPVTITRDADAVPHIKAANEADALFGLGYVHAQDRLWQMEFQRRVGFGRLSEVLGDGTIDTDTFLRTLGTGRAAASAWQQLQPDDQALIKAYIAGINEFINTHHGRELPIEFTILGFEPAPWTPEDVLVWVKMMAYNLGDNWEDELLRSHLVAKLGAEKTAELLPAAATDDPLILPGGVSNGNTSTTSTPVTPIRGSALLAIQRQIQQELGLGGTMIGSNNWVIGGARTTTGKPLLADDPHLGAQVPSIWYLAHVTGGKLDAIGATVPGLPGVVIGHNQRIAWGVTNTGPDVQDLFIEHINERDEVEYRGQFEPMQVINDVIKVKGQADVALKIRITRHGPLISDAVDDMSEPVAIRWTALDGDDSTFSAFLGINYAQNWQEFVAALEPYSAPMQNFVYADVDGNIGYYAPGKLPIRAKGDGTAPAPGWTGEYDWQSYVPLAELPHTYNPPEGYIASANNRVVGADYPYFIGSTFAAPYRAKRIVELISAKPKLSPDDIAAMHADVTSVQAREMLPLLLTAETSDTRSQQALDLLRNWDGTLSGDSPAAAIYEAWYRHLSAAIIGDELGDDLFEEIDGPSSDHLAIALPHILQGQGTNWCDNITTPAPETCAQQIGKALDDGLAEMATAQGANDIARWRWDTVHHTRFPHNPFDNVGILKPIFSRSIPNGGDKFTVDVAPPRNQAGKFNQYHVPSYREIIDLSNLDASRFMHTVGQSGQLLSSDYDNLISRWQKVEYLPMRFSDSLINEHARGTLILTP